MGYKNILNQVINMKENGTKIFNKDKEKWFIIIKMNIKDIGIKILNKVKEKWFIIIKMNI